LDYENQKDKVDREAKGQFVAAAARFSVGDLKRHWWLFALARLLDALAGWWPLRGASSEKLVLIIIVCVDLSLPSLIHL